jgi:Mce-associated membrane protein
MANRPRTSSRTPASRPRKVAGHGGAPPVEREPVEQEAPDDLDEGPDPDPGDRASAVPEQRAGRASLFAGGRVTRVLLATIVLLTALTLAMAGWLWLGGDDADEAAAPPPEGEIAVPEGRPILLPWADAQAAAATAAEAATTALATNWQEYDAQLDEKVALMTPGFAEEFRTTATDAKAGVVEGRLDIAVRVVAQSVVRANASEVQVTTAGGEQPTGEGSTGGESTEEQPQDGAGTTVSPYRVLVTMVNTDGGWLVSDLETR